MTTRGIFETGQNLIGSSNVLDPTVWSGRYLGIGLSVISSGSIAPNGRPEAVDYATTSYGVSYSYLFQDVGFLPNRYYTASVWAKRKNNIVSPYGNVVEAFLPTMTWVTTPTPVSSLKLGEWKRFSHTIFTGSFSGVYSSWVGIHTYVQSNDLISYWGFSLTETDKLYPYVVTSSEVESGPFSTVICADPTYRTKYRSKVLVSANKSLSGYHYELGGKSTEMTKLHIEGITQECADYLDYIWGTNRPVLVSDGVYPESYPRKIANKTKPSDQYDHEVSDTYRMILEMEKY